MNIDQLMGDRVAQEAYMAIPAGADPLDVADQYLEAKLQGRDSACRGIELHIRQLAQIHFQDDRVLKALARMERYQRMRKLGTGGSADLKRIARAIEKAYAAGDHEVVDGMAVFCIDNLTIRCENRPGAVALVVAKYRRGLPRRNWRAV